MGNIDIAQRRLRNQRVSSEPLDRPEDLVRWLGAVQSQEYLAAKWAMAQRLRSMTDADLDRAFNEGQFLRTHVMRPTWHFVLPEDIRWMLELTAPRIKGGLGYRHRELGLGPGVLARANDALAKALQGGHALTRQEAREVLQNAGVDMSDPAWLSHIMMHAELDLVVCSGPMRGKQQTYALLDERAPNAKSLPRDEAVALLTRRYFASHGPATIKDFVWWSGLTTADCRAGIEMAKSDLASEVVGAQTYWSGVDSPPSDPPTEAYLLPNFDEYGVGYADRSAHYDEAHTDHVNLRGGLALGNIVVIGGQIKGEWKRTLGKTIVVEVRTYTGMDAPERDALAAAAQRYSAFLGLPVELRVSTPAAISV